MIGSEIFLDSAVNHKNIFVLKLDNVSQCVVPANNRDDIEIQFADSQARERHEDCLVQVTFHFPKDETEEGVSIAEDYHQQIMGTGAIKSVTGDILVEFSKEQGNFVAPRGKYAIQVRSFLHLQLSMNPFLIFTFLPQLTSTYMHMQGAQYAYKIPYSEMDSFFLLEKSEGGRSAFVISLTKPIRQGNQKYSNLVIETHAIENTVKVNLTQQEIDEKYEGKLAPEITMPMAHLFGKLFKVITGVKVFMPKQFLSAKGSHCIRCSIKANEGLLYPLAKCFIFIHKPTVIIKFDDIDQVEFKRYEPVANSATRNFDLCITMKENAVGAGEWKEYTFMSIDRSEYVSLFDYIQSKELKIKNPQKPGAAAMELGLDEDEDDEEEDDEDYNSEKESEGSGSEDESGSGEGSGEESVKEEKKPKAKKEKVEKPKKEKKEKVEKPKKEKKEKAEKSEKSAKVKELFS